MLSATLKLQKQYDRVELNKIVLRNSDISPLGGIRLAGVLGGSIGVHQESRVLSRYSLAYIASGSGRYISEAAGTIEVQSGHLILIQPGQSHWYGPYVGTTWSEIFFEFEGPLFDLWFESYAKSMTLPLIKLEPIDYWRDRLLTTIGEANCGNRVRMLDECNRVQAFLCDIMNAQRQNFVDEIEWLEKAKAALKSEQDGKDAAMAMDMSYESFRKKFKRVVGLSPGKYRLSLMMDVACNLLEDEQRTIKSIALQLGFCDEYHFSKQFKKMVGWSPSQYRAGFCAGSGEVTRGFAK